MSLCLRLARPMPLLLAAACAAPVSPSAPATSPMPSGPPPAVRSAPVAAARGSIPAFDNPRIHEIVAATSAERIEHDVRVLAGFGTRHTLSDTLSQQRGIGGFTRSSSASLRIVAGVSR